MANKKEKPAQLSDFKDKKRYKYIGDNAWVVPNGVLTRGYKQKHTGKEWKAIFVYDFSPHSTPAFSKIFKEVKVCKTHTLKAIKVGNPMVYQCLKCNEIVKSKKDKKK